MATDIFCQIDGIKGESTDKDHKDWIELLSFSWGMSQPVSAASATGGRGAERVDISDFSVMKTSDASSPHLMQACCDGRHINKVVIKLCQAGGEKHPYMTYSLENVIVSTVQPSSSGGDKPIENVTFNFGKYTVEYTPMGHDGKPGSKVGPMGWNLEANTKM